VFFFKSYEAGRQAFQADDIDIMWFDEEPPMTIFNETKMRLIDRRGIMIITMTSLSGFTEFVKNFYNRVDATHDFYILDTYHNSRLRRDEIDSLTKDMTEEEKQARLHGVPLMRSGLVFKEWNDRAPWVIPEKIIKEEDYGAYTFYVGIDTHLKLPTYAVLVAVDASGFHYVLDEICVAGSIGNFIEEYKGRWGLFPIMDVFIDPSSISIEGKVGSSSIVEELDAADISVTPAIKDPSERIRILGKSFKPVLIQDGALAGTTMPTIQIGDNCEKLREQLRWYVWDDYSGSKLQDRKEEKDAPRKKNDHLIDALGYLECAIAGLTMEYDREKTVYKEESVLTFEDYI
jgi:phage terminase large subunit-like protein